MPVPVLPYAAGFNTSVFSVGPGIKGVALPSAHAACWSLKWGESGCPDWPQGMWR